MTHRILLILAFLLTPALALAQSLTGAYTAQGRNANGSAYVGTVWIEDLGAAVSVDWEVGSQAYSGTGTREGNVLVVNWGGASPVYYVILSNGELHGTWANGTALEKLTPR
ncbi:MAG: hypothetical protein AUK37_00570 [Rhodobacterales bacterium CG2_30_65_12]|nr:MAG: hypothetical protein AUK37_00570 [Rhodobacterales bacterium CG2_30_65_12]